MFIYLILTANILCRIVFVQLASQGSNELNNAVCLSGTIHQLLLEQQAKRKSRVIVFVVGKCGVKLSDVSAKVSGKLFCTFYCGS